MLSHFRRLSGTRPFVGCFSPADLSDDADDADDAAAAPDFARGLLGGSDFFDSAASISAEAVAGGAGGFLPLRDLPRGDSGDDDDDDLEDDEPERELERDDRGVHTSSAGGTGCGCRSRDLSSSSSGLSRRLHMPHLRSPADSIAPHLEQRTTSWRRGAADTVAAPHSSRKDWGAATVPCCAVQHTWSSTMQSRLPALQRNPRPTC
jgi:hypothetical protein